MPDNIIKWKPRTDEVEEARGAFMEAYLAFEDAPPESEDIALVTRLFPCRHDEEIDCLAKAARWVRAFDKCFPTSPASYKKSTNEYYSNFETMKTFRDHFPGPDSLARRIVEVTIWLIDGFCISPPEKWDSFPHPRRDSILGAFQEYF